MNSPALSGAAEPAAAQQMEIFQIADVEGYGVLTRRERLFAAAIFEGCTQREAAKRAGVSGSDDVCDVAGARLMKSERVRRLLDQAWTRAGADISRTLREAEEIRRRAYREIVDGRNAKTAREAMTQWREAATLIASVHGRIGVRIEGDIHHRHSGAVGTITVPADALPALAQLRRDVITDRIAAAMPVQAQDAKGGHPT